jgi:hypothetical protein
MRCAQPTGMKAIHVGLVADPTSPSSIARRMSDLGPPGRRDRDAWDVEVVSESFTVGSGDVDTTTAGISWPKPTRNDARLCCRYPRSEGSVCTHAPVRQWARSSAAWPANLSGRALDPAVMGGYPPRINRLRRPVRADVVRRVGGNRRRRPWHGPGVGRSDPSRRVLKARGGAP